VRVIDGKPAWVTYYVPGEILGFEVDTHHYGALATEFHFAAGSSWRDLQPVEATAEEISGFAAKWMRLYRANSALPAGTQFLRIEFPTGEDAAAARLTEVWLRCRFGSAARSPFEPAEGFFSPSPEANPPAATPPPSPAKAEPATTGDVVVEPIVVAAFVMTPPAPPPPAPIFGPADVDPTPPAIAVLLPPRLSPVNLLADEAPLIPTAAVPVPPRSLFGKVATFFRRIF
jgi:hypothetical protein